MAMELRSKPSELPARLFVAFVPPMEMEMELELELELELEMEMELPSIPFSFCISSGLSGREKGKRKRQLWMEKQLPQK